MSNVVLGGRYEAVKFVFMDSDGNLLLERRSARKSIMPGLLTFPAGHVDSSDMKPSKAYAVVSAHRREDLYLLRTLARESLEELGIVPKIAVFLGKYSFALPDRRYRLFYYLCKGFDKASVPSVSMEKPPAKLIWKAFSAVSGTLRLKQDLDVLSSLARKQPVICVSGTPGTGKTTLAKLLSDRLNLAYLGISEAVSTNRLYERFDKKTGSYIVSPDVLKRFVRGMLQKRPFGWVVDGHMSHLLPKSLVDVCIVCRTNLKTLHRRLLKRNYPAAKVRENLDAEIFDVCGQEAKESGHAVLYLDTSVSSPEELFSAFMTHLSSLDTPLFPVEAIDSFQKL